MRPRVNPGVGMPGWLKLNVFGTVVFEAFPECLGVFHVGSSLLGKTWRDVDVRLMLTDDDFARIVGEHVQPRCLNPRWNALCLAFAALGRDMTGLPIDFQIDQQSWANEKFPTADHPRSALGTLPTIEAEAAAATATPSEPFPAPISTEEGGGA